MKATIAAAMLAASAAQAIAGQSCIQGSAEILKATAWSAEPNGKGTMIKITFENVSGKPIKMVAGNTWFSDALDQPIGGVSIQPDFNLAPGASVTQENGMAGFQRLQQLKPGEAVALTCVDAVVFEDGSKEKF